MAELCSDTSCLVPGKHYIDGVCLPGFLSVDHLKEIKQLKVNPEDVLVTGYMRSGNTWLMATLNAIFSADNLQAFTESGKQLNYIDFPPIIKIIKQLESPRVLHSHLRYHMLPEDIKKNGVKIIHINRDPRDVAVSSYHLSQIWNLVNYQGTWEAFLDAFLRGEVMYGSWWDYTKDWSAHKDDPNILFIDYEEFSADTVGTISKIANFIGKSLNGSTLQDIASIVSFDSMKKNPNINNMNPQYFDESKGHFLHSGRIGDWKNYFTNEQEGAFESAHETKQSYSVS